LGQPPLSLKPNFQFHRHPANQPALRAPATTAVYRRLLGTSRGGVGVQADSPQVRGRCERFFETVQDRWPREFADIGVKSYTAANRELDRRLIADFNRRFTVQPAEPETAFVPLVGFRFPSAVGRVLSRDGFAFALPQSVLAFWLSSTARVNIMVEFHAL
jgi:hypothetical protein